MDVAVSTRTGPHQVVVTISGVVDLATRDTVRGSLLVAAEGAERLVVDLRDVTFLDSTGLGLLVAARRRVRGAGGSMAVLNARPSVRRVFEVAGLVEALDVQGEGLAPRRLPRQTPTQQREPANGAT